MGTIVRRNRRGLVAFAVLASILFCTLVAGTPVNNDPSPAAERAGIHLTTVHGAPRMAAPATTPAVVAVWALCLLLVATTETTPARRRPGRTRPPGSLVRSWASTRRGPPPPAAIR